MASAMGGSARPSGRHQDERRIGVLVHRLADITTSSRAGEGRRCPAIVDLDGRNGIRSDVPVARALTRASTRPGTSPRPLAITRSR